MKYVVINPIESIVNPHEEDMDTKWPNQTEQNSDMIQSNREELDALKQSINSSDTQEKIEALNKALALQKDAGSQMKMELMQLISKLSSDISDEIIELGIKLEDLENGTKIAMHVLEMELDKKHCMDLERRNAKAISCLLYTSPSPRDATLSRMPSSA